MKIILELVDILFLIFNVIKKHNALLSRSALICKLLSGLSGRGLLLLLHDVSPTSVVASSLRMHAADVGETSGRRSSRPRLLSLDGN